MSRQITVRLASEMVEFADSVVASGDASGRAEVVAAALRREARRRLVLTRELVRPHLRRVTVAPITRTVRGLSTEVPVDERNGLTAPSVVNCDAIVTVPADLLGAQLGFLLDHQEPALARAITLALDLEL